MWQLSKETSNIECPSYCRTILFDGVEVGQIIVNSKSEELLQEILDSLNIYTKVLHELHHRNNENK